MSSSDESELDDLTAGLDGLALGLGELVEGVDDRIHMITNILFRQLKISAALFNALKSQHTYMKNTTGMSTKRVKNAEKFHRDIFKMFENSVDLLVKLRKTQKKKK